MRVLRSVLYALCTALLCAALTPSAMADQWNKKTVITFDAPVEIPGKVLPAGTYVFILYDSQADRHIVQVWNEDRTKLLATGLAIPNSKLEPAGKTILRFEERSGDEPQALRAWFYPGDNFGQEFVYPKTRATQLAVASNTNVPEMSNDVNTTETNEETSRQNLAQTTVAVATPSEQPQTAQEQPQPMPTAEPHTTPTPQPERQEREELPKTASPMPLVGLIGILSLAVGFGLRLFSKRVS